MLSQGISTWHGEEDTHFEMRNHVDESVPLVDAKLVVLREEA
jgi:hypothetical protein